MDLSEKSKDTKKLLNEYCISPSRAEKINAFLISKKENIELVPYSHFIQSNYRPAKIRKDNIPDLFNIYTKIRKGFDKLLAYPLSSNFISANSSELPTLLSIEKKVKRNKYSSIYEFGNDLRNFWNFYFLYYSNSPEDFQRTYYMSEYSESIIKKMESIKQNFYIEPKKISIAEKEKLADDITKLNPENLKKVISFLKGFVNENKKESEEKIYEFDFEKLTKDKLYKLKKCVDKLMKVQNEQTDMKLNKEEMERIQQLRVRILLLNIL